MNQRMWTTMSLLSIVIAGASCGKGKGKGTGGGDQPDSEAQIQLDALRAKATKYMFKNDQKFPVGSIGLTPSTPCCQQPNKTCAPSPSDWANPPWSDLGFKMTSEPFVFQYSYQGDATSYTATAVGDPDCDGHTITVVAHGLANGGEPSQTVTMTRK